MNNLLISTGHSGVMSLCGVLGNPKNKHTVTLLRGSVFFLGIHFYSSLSFLLLIVVFNYF